MQLPDHPLSIHTPYSDPTPAARIIFHPPLYFYFEYFKHKQSRKKSLINSMYSGPRFSNHHHENLVLPFPPIILKQILETIYDIWKYFSLSLQSMRMLPYFLKICQFTSLPRSQSPWLLLKTPKSLPFPAQGHRDSSCRLPLWPFPWLWPCTLWPIMGSSFTAFLATVLYLL